MRPPVLSAGAVVVRWFGAEPRYLLLRAYHYWDFPKGQVEEGEDALQTAKREVAEEAGLTDLEFRWGRDYRETPVYGRGKVARYYLAESPAGEAYLPVSPELGRPEHHELQWADYRTAHARLGERLRPILEWAHATVSEA